MSVNENVWDGFGLPRTAFSRLIKHYMKISKDFRTQVWITPLETKSGMAQDRPLSHENGYKRSHPGIMYKMTVRGSLE